MVYKNIAKIIKSYKKYRIFVCVDDSNMTEPKLYKRIRNHLKDHFHSWESEVVYTPRNFYVQKTEKGLHHILS